MNKNNRQILVRAAMIIPSLALASIVVVADMAYTNLADDITDSLQSSDRSRSKLVEGYQSDAKWMQVNDRIVLQPWETTEVADTARLDETPFPVNVLPGFAKLKAATHMAADSHRKEDSERTLSKSFAWIQAKSFCKMAASYTPEQVANNEGASPRLILTDETIPNLPIYSEYCGVDALQYKEVLSQKLVLKEAKDAEFRAELDKMRQGSTSS